MKIEKLEIDHINGNYITVQQRLNQVIEALNSITVEKIREPEGKQVSNPSEEKRGTEKKEKWKPCTCPKGSTDCDKCDGVEYVKEEPKSTLRESIFNIVDSNVDSDGGIGRDVSEEIISLFKDTLLKEMEKGEWEITSLEDIKEIIKTL